MRFSAVLLTFAVVGLVTANELDDYVKAPDPNYSWTLVDTFRDPLLNTYTGYNLRLVSQRWGQGLVIPEHEIWSHYLTISALFTLILLTTVHSVIIFAF